MENHGDRYGSSAAQCAAVFACESDRTAEAVKQAVLAERERCAKIAEDMAVAAFGDIPLGLIRQHVCRIAVKIRSGK